MTALWLKLFRRIVYKVGNLQSYYINEIYPRPKFKSVHSDWVKSLYDLYYCIDIICWLKIRGHTCCWGRPQAIASSKGIDLKAWQWWSCTSKSWIGNCVKEEDWMLTPYLIKQQLVQQAVISVFGSCIGSRVDHVRLSLMSILLVPYGWTYIDVRVSARKFAIILKQRNKQSNSIKIHLTLHMPKSRGNN